MTTELEPFFDLEARARKAVADFGFEPDFPPLILDEVARLAIATPPAGTLDFRDLLWSSIDNSGTRDLDQVEYAEQLANGDIRLLVGIADVDSLVKAGSDIDLHARVNTTSLYTGVKIFPMLPEKLSTDLTSLVAGESRMALVFDLAISDTGVVQSRNVAPALVRNRAQLDYNSVGDWLEGRTQAPAAVKTVPGLEEQLQLQREASRRLHRFRQEHGALVFGEREASAVMEGGQLRQLTVERANCAREIIEGFMVAANIAAAQFLKNQNRPSLRRVVKAPKNWDRIREIVEELGASLPLVPDPKPLSVFLAQRREADPAAFPDLSLSIVKLLGPGEYIVEKPDEPPEGHFGLAVQDYTHSTAPNRRYPDLITQRLLKNTTPYLEPELETIAAHCNERAAAARKLERLMRKILAAVLLRKRIGTVFQARITGVKPHDTFARLTEFPAEGRLSKGASGLRVGDTLRVRLSAVDPNRGFIDLERVP